ncbi:hypothetical protein Tco_0712685 [Tanacetum coccineum]
MITEFVRITTDQPNGLDVIEQLILIRENDKPNSFSKADFKYLNKNDIKDLYYLCLNKKVKYHETKLLNSLKTFIRSWVIWERVHDFQLGIKSYQIKVMYLMEIVKFCDATLEKVLKEVNLKIFQSEPWRKEPLLGRDASTCMLQTRGGTLEIKRAFEEKGVSTKKVAFKKKGVFAETGGQRRMIHPLGGYIITLYTNGKLRTRVTVTLVGGAEASFIVNCLYLCPSFFKGHTPKGIGLRVADSHTGNHREDDFTPPETFKGFPCAFGM